MERLYGFFDTDGSGTISYVEFVQGLALLSPSTSAAEKVRLPSSAFLRRPPPSSAVLRLPPPSSAVLRRPQAVVPSSDATSSPQFTSSRLRSPQHAVLRPASAAVQVKLAFLLCDLDSSGGVTLDNLTRILQMSRAANPAATNHPTAATAPPPAEMPFLARSASQQASTFARFDVDGNKQLDFDEFATFVLEHPDVLDLSTSLVQERLQAADLLSSLASTVAKIKRQRSGAAESAGGSPLASAAGSAAEANGPAARRVAHADKGREPGAELM